MRGRVELVLWDYHGSLRQIEHCGKGRGVGSYHGPSDDTIPGHQVTLKLYRQDEIQDKRAYFCIIYLTLDDHATRFPLRTI